MVNPNDILKSIAKELREPLIDCYKSIKQNYSQHRWEPAELNGGKFCEIVYTILDGYISGAYANKPSKPSNMLISCQNLEKTVANPQRIGDRSVRILIPRLLSVLYEIRNNRGVGHVGGDVNPNFLDATAVLSMTSWILAELVRIFHNTTTKDAQDIVDSLIEKTHPLIWEVDNIKRVLDPKMKKGDQALLLLYSQPSWVDDKKLFEWVEYTSLAKFRLNILIPQHEKRFTEYDQTKNRVHITPLGIKEVESRLIINK